jgi:hypothetical protein
MLIIAYAYIYFGFIVAILLKLVRKYKEWPSIPIVLGWPVTLIYIILLEMRGWFKKEKK